MKVLMMCDLEFLCHDEGDTMPTPRRFARKLVTGLLWSAALIASAAGASEQVQREASVEVLPAPGPSNLLLGKPIAHGSLETRYWSAGQPVAGLSMSTPVLIASGHKPGPTLCLTAAVHGDELNGVEIIRRIMYAIDVNTLSGTIISVPIVNLHGFRRNSRYLPDRRDLNRYFPGNPSGSSASRIAYSFFTEIISHCEWLIDIHTGSFHRTNLTQLRADMGDESVSRLGQLFGNIPVLHSSGQAGTLRRAAVDAGIPAVTIEAGEPLRLQPNEVQAGVKAVTNAMIGLGMLPGRAQKQRQQVYYESLWLRADQSGVLFSEVALGSKVEQGDILGSVTDPITNLSSVIRSPAKGRILGMALNQMVMPGFAAYHLGIDSDDKEAAAQQAAERAADQALETVREVVTEAAREAAKSTAQATDDPEAVSAAARRAAEAATKDVVKSVGGTTLPQRKAIEETPDEGDNDAPEPVTPSGGPAELDEHPE